MPPLAIIAEDYFDGARHHGAGPYTIRIAEGRIEEILPGDHGDALAARHRSLRGGDLRVERAAFVMPGLAEAHCHLFLDGAELDFEKRKAYLGASREEMLRVGRRSLRQSLESGVTLLRDAGDLHGVNTALQAELSARPEDLPTLLSAGRALRKKGRYGGFMAVEVSEAADIAGAVRELAQSADQIKVLLTGIIDFEHGRMKGGVQFDLEETRLIVRAARELGKRTFAHCSGAEGLRIAVEAGIDSIEHGFFMERDILRAMADRGVAWVPTFAPVWFQHARPELSGWGRETVEGLWRILERHLEMVALARDFGVPVVAGSDAGSYGVPHGAGLIDELGFLLRAGLPLEAVLASATSVPRGLWGLPPADLRAGLRPDLVAFAGSPFAEVENLRRPCWAVAGTSFFPLAGGPSASDGPIPADTAPNRPRP